MPSKFMRKTYEKFVSPADKEFACNICLFLLGYLFSRRSIIYRKSIHLKKGGYYETFVFLLSGIPDRLTKRIFCTGKT